MPEWKIHNKWAEKAGISKEVSGFVNLLIDFPQKCQEFLDFCDREQAARIYKGGKSTRMTILPLIRHNSARNKKYARKIQLEFLRQKGDEYIKAWYLHQILDYLKWWVTEEPSEYVLSIEDILQAKRLDRQIGSPQDRELQNIKNFVMNHSEEILRDCR
jgi:hypothetical protein